MATNPAAVFACERFGEENYSVIKIKGRGEMGISRNPRTGMGYEEWYMYRTQHLRQPREKAGCVILVPRKDGQYKMLRNNIFNRFRYKEYILLCIDNLENGLPRKVKI